MTIPFPSLRTVGKIFIGVFFFWHVFATGLGGFSNTLERPMFQYLEEHAYGYVSPYLGLLHQHQQNWGFFSFVPNSIVRISIAVWNEEQKEFIELDEYKQVEMPYIGRHNQFNFVRSITEESDKYNEIRERYLLWYCQQNNISDATLYLRKKYAVLPAEPILQYYDWSRFEPEWRLKNISEAHCPPL